MRGSAFPRVRSAPVTVVILLGILAATTPSVHAAAPTEGTLSVYLADAGTFRSSVTFGGAADGAPWDVPVPAGASVTSVLLDTGSVSAPPWFRVNATAVRVLAGNVTSGTVIAAGDLAGPLDAAATSARVEWVLPTFLPVVVVEAHHASGRHVEIEGGSSPDLVDEGGWTIARSTATDVAAGSRFAVVTPATGASAAPDPFAAVAVFSLVAIAVSLIIARVRRAPRVQSPAAGWLDHLRELQARLVRVMMAFGIFVILFFTFGLGSVDVAGFALPFPSPTVTNSISAHVFRAIAADVVPETVTLVVTSPVDGILTQIDVTLLLAVVATLPLLTWEASAFLAPALYPNERRLALVLIPVVLALFAVGVWFAYEIMVPFTMRTLYGYAGDLGATSFLAVDRLVTFTVLLLIVFGCAFETPAVMAGLARAGVVRPGTFAKKWRHALVAIFVASALVSDPTVVSQFLVAVPLVALYAIGVGAAYVVAKPRDGEG